MHVGGINPGFLVRQLLKHSLIVYAMSHMGSAQNMLKNKGTSIYYAYFSGKIHNKKQECDVHTIYRNGTYIHTGIERERER